ncbi:MAG: hypothetical protein HQL52_06555 [Magnetococcales bacterium]|nr:hypothetical protein [Magnetococcales bacterium]
MGLIRILIFIALGVMAYRLLQRLMMPPPPPAPKAPEEDPTLVQCKGCGTWVPRNSAVMQGDGPSCGQPGCWKPSDSDTGADS